MNEFNNMVKESVKLTDVKIISIPPITVASSHFLGKDCIKRASQTLYEFVLKSNLMKINPDVRHFSFENPKRTREDWDKPYFGCEQWVSIPKDMEVPLPLRKINFHGGLYAAHIIKYGEFELWPHLWEWVNKNELYKNDYGAIRCTPYMEAMDWCMEETLDYISYIKNLVDDSETKVYINLMVPIKNE